jgi:hypothetical protein
MKTNLILKKITWTVLLFLVFTSCQNADNSTSIDSNNTETLSIRSTINPNGNVFSSENQPIENVTVKKLGNVIARSNASGNFTLDGTILNEGDVITYEHPDFITVTKVLKTNSSLSIFMKRRAAGKIIDSRRGGAIALEKGGGIRIPANAFSFRGSPYNGAVKITASYIDVTDENELRSAPGAYIAFDEDRSTLIPLTSFGMIEVNAVIPETNDELQLNKGRTIDAVFPILTSNTPTTVNLYEFDTEIGYWTLAGQLNTVQNTLQGEITTVNSTWNADEPCSEDLICVKVKIEYANGNPGCQVGVEGVTYEGSDGLYIPDANGYVEFSVCPDSVFELGACWIPCCGPNVPPSDTCCNNPQYRTTIDLSTVTLNPNDCTDLGTWVVPN